MELTRAQEQRLTRLEEMAAETKHQFAAIMEMLAKSHGNQRSDDQFTLNRNTPMKVKGDGSGGFERMRDDDQRFDDKEETRQVHETLTNPAPIEEDVSSDQICDEKELVSIDLDLQEVQTKTVAEEKLNLPNGQNVEHLVGKNFETFSTEYRSFLNLSSSNGYQKDSTWIESSLYLLCLLKNGRVWEPGGVPKAMDLWGWPETELKPCGESQQVETFLYSLMQVVKRNNKGNLEFKTFESNKTFSLKDEQDDESEQNQVIKLISLWNNRIWEPGGVLIEHDKWNWLEKCYNRGRLMRLTHWMSSMWWKEIKSRKSDRVSACSCVDIKIWHCVKHETQQTDFHVWHRWKNKAGSVKDVKTQRLQKLQENQVQFAMLCVQEVSEEKGNSRIEKLGQEEFPDVFSEPKDLSPFRAHPNHKIKLLEGSKKHYSWSQGIFHVSQLRTLVGNIATTTHLSPVLQDEFEKEPEPILERQMVKRQGRAVTKIMVKWVNGSTEEATWESSVDFQKKYLDFETETLRSRFCKRGRCDTVWYVWAARVNTRN